MKCPNCGYELPPHYQPNKERDEELKRLYHEELWTPKQLSRKYYVGVGRIKQIIGCVNLRLDNKVELRRERRQKIWTDRQSGMTFKKIGEKHGISAASARYYFLMEERYIRWRKRREEQEATK